MRLLRTIALLHLSAFVASAATFCFEAEYANSMSLPFEITRTQGTSGPGALAIPEGAGDSTAFHGARNGIKPGTATYRIPFLQGKRWWVWLRVRWNGNCSNSLFVRIGDRTETAMNERFDVWHWIKIDRPFEATNRITNLVLRNREDGILVDQILLTDSTMRRIRGHRNSNLIPGDPDNRHSEPILFLGSGSAGLAAVPPTDYRLSHKGHKPTSLPHIRRYVLQAGEPTDIVVWLRSNALAEFDGKVRLDTAAPVRVKQGAEQLFKLQRGEALHRLVFSLVPDSPIPGREYRAFIRVRCANGRILGKKVTLHSPFNWLVTNHLPCREATGIETPCDLEQHLQHGFPGNTDDVSWRTADHSAITPFGLLDMRRAVADRNYAMAYAYTCLDSGVAGDHILDVRHDDAIRIWLNGSHVFTSLEHRPSVQTRQLVTVPLKKGRNHLLVKLCQRKNYWEFGTVFLTTDGRPAPVNGYGPEQLPKTGK